MTDYPIVSKGAYNEGARKGTNPVHLHDKIKEYCPVFRTDSYQSFHNLRWIHRTQNLFHEVSRVGWFKEYPIIVL